MKIASARSPPWLEAVHGQHDDGQHRQHGLGDDRDATRREPPEQETADQRDESKHRSFSV
jgi:hypothetical protein